MAGYSTLAKLLPDNVECFVLDSTPSTNDYLADQPFSNNTKVCIAREQTCGKGQYNRQWLSKKNSSILLSIRRNFSVNTLLNGLSLVVGLAVIEVLTKKYGINQLKLKWPNDVYFQTQKLAGILLESSVQNNTQSVVIGLGLNNDLGENFVCETPWIDLNQILKSTPNLEQLSAKLINKIIDYCGVFELQGLDAFQSKWREYDYLSGKPLELSYQNEKITGVANGINDEGALLIESDKGVIEAYSSEQIHLI